MYLFLDESKVTSAVKKHLEEIPGINIQPYDQAMIFFANIVSIKKICLLYLKCFYSTMIDDVDFHFPQLRQNKDTDSKIWITHSSSYIFVSLVPEKQLVTDASPIAAMKAIKNEVETEGIISD